MFRFFTGHYYSPPFSLGAVSPVLSFTTPPTAFPSSLTGCYVKTIFQIHLEYDHFSLPSTFTICPDGWNLHLILFHSCCSSIHSQPRNRNEPMNKWCAGSCHSTPTFSIWCRTEVRFQQWPVLLPVTSLTPPPTAASLTASWPLRLVLRDPRIGAYADPSASDTCLTWLALTTTLSTRPSLTTLLKRDPSHFLSPVYDYIFSIAPISIKHTVPFTYSPYFSTVSPGCSMKSWNFVVCFDHSSTPSTWNSGCYIYLLNKCIMSSVGKIGKRYQ